MEAPTQGKCEALHMPFSTNPADRKGAQPPDGRVQVSGKELGRDQVAPVLSQHLVSPEPITDHSEAFAPGVPQLVWEAEGSQVPRKAWSEPAAASCHQKTGECGRMGLKCGREEP